jgi:Tfp pilus assembly PilM family ATPase
MAKSCGIRIGPRRFELVVLEGGPRKHRITAFATGDLPASGDVAETAHVLKEVAKAHHIPWDSTSIAIDTGLAAFRTIKLPTLDESKIGQIIKFEVEGQLPQWNIDDVVVDFLPLERTPAEMNLLVSAVPKAELKRVLEICSKAGIEPLEAELEATAMVNAALGADICHPDDAQVLVHIGETSTAVVVVDGGHVRSLRAIHIGALSHEPEAEEPAAEGAEGAQQAPPAVPADPEEVQRRMEQAVSRIRRELGRTLSGARTANPIGAVYVCGWELPELVGTSVLDVPVFELDVFEEDSGQPAEGVAPLVVAYGAALRQLGSSAIRASLRREELRYTGAFERIEMPLAVAALLLVTTLAVFNIFEFYGVGKRDYDVYLWLRSASNFMLGDPKKGVRGNLEQPWPALENYVARTVPAKSDLPHTRLEQLGQIERLLALEIDKLNKELGNTGEVTQPQSALEGLTLVTGTIGELEDQGGRIAIRKALSTYRVGRSGANDSVEVRLDLTFFNADSVAATHDYERLTNDLRAKPWVQQVDTKGSKPLEEGSGISVDGYTVVCDLSKVERLQQAGA